jgi:4-hydroxy-3-polyprenylbenzoate decarboxylase
MPYKDLQDFIADCDNKGEVIHIHHEIDPKLEITEIADRIFKEGNGELIVFHNVKSYDIPVVMNIFGTKERTNQALYTDDLNKIGDRISEMLQFKPPKGIMAKVNLLPKLMDLTKFPPRNVKRGICQEIVYTGEDVDLGKIPVPLSWPDDGGPFITLPQVITRDPETGLRNVGMYRLQVFDKNTTGMHWQRHKSGAEHFRKGQEKSLEKIEVAVVIGGDPSEIYSASAPLPPGIDEYTFAGFLRNSPVELVPCKTVDLEVPADAEIVLEGYVDPNEELAWEGPFGDHTGFYSLADWYPKFHVTAITMRKSPVYPHTIVGRPPMEDQWMGYATERIFLALTKIILPEVVNYHMPVEGVFHNLVFVSIKKKYPGHAFKVMHSLWGMGLMMLAKVIVVVDEDVDVENIQETWWVTLGNIDPERDVIFSKGPVDVLDHASQHFSYGSKMGIDATRKWKEEGFDRDWPEKIVMDPAVKEKVNNLWNQIYKKS